MFKKLLIFSILFTANSCFAISYISFPQGKPYVGAAAGIQNIHGYNGLYGNFFAGMGITTSPHIYLGGEAFIDTGSIPISQKKIGRTTYGAGISFLPGVMIAPNTMAYVRAGIASFRFNDNNAYDTGGQLGLGLQTNIARCWDIRGEYVYTGKGVIEGFGTSQFNFFNIGLVFKFA